jgi:hypothetical protein
LFSDNIMAQSTLLEKPHVHAALHDRRGLGG